MADWHIAALRALAWEKKKVGCPSLGRGICLPLARKVNKRDAVSGFLSCNLSLRDCTGTNTYRIWAQVKQPVTRSCQWRKVTGAHFAQMWDPDSCQAVHQSWQHSLGAQEPQNCTRQKEPIPVHQKNAHGSSANTSVYWVLRMKDMSCSWVRHWAPNIFHILLSLFWVL